MPFQGGQPITTRYIPKDDVVALSGRQHGAVRGKRHGKNPTHRLGEKRQFTVGRHIVQPYTNATSHRQHLPIGRERHRLNRSFSQAGKGPLRQMPRYIIGDFQAV